MTTLNFTDLGTATALSPEALNDRFNAVQRLLNGRLTPDNLATDQVHVPVLIRTVNLATSGGADLFIMRRPVTTVGACNITLGLLSAYCSYSGAGTDTLQLLINGHATYSDAAANIGPTLLYDQTLSAGASGWQGVDPDVTTDITAVAYRYLRITVAATTGTWTGVSLSGEIVYTIQAT